MIQLYHASKVTSPPHPTPPVRQVVYRELEDVPVIIKASRPHQKSSLRATAPSFVPLARVASPDPFNGKEAPFDSRTLEYLQSTIEEAEELKFDDALESVDTIGDQATETEALTHPVDVLQPWNSAAAATSEEEVKAASVIQRVYQRTLSRRKGSAKAGLAATRASIYDTCLVEARKIEWPYKYYKLLFLGPLVHALLCLEVIHDFVLSLKSKTKKLFRNATYQELQDLGQRQTRLS